MNNSDTERYVCRYYKISINFGLVYYYYNSKNYRFRKGISPYLVGFLYSLLNLLTGFFWGFLGILRKFQGLRNSINAIHINLTGGEDITKAEIESNFDKYTVYIYNNLDRTTSNEIGLLDVNIVLDIQELYSETNNNLYKTENIMFLLENLSKVNMKHINRKHIKSIFNAINIYNEYNNKYDGYNMH